MSESNAYGLFSFTYQQLAKHNSCLSYYEVINKFLYYVKITQ